MLQAIPRCSVTSRTLAIVLVPALLLFPSLFFANHSLVPENLLMPPSAIRLDAEVVEKLDHVRKNLIGLSEFLEKKEAANGNRSPTKLLTREKLESSAALIGVQVKQYQQQGNSPDCARLLRASVESVMAFVDEAYQFDDSFSSGNPVDFEAMVETLTVLSRLFLELSLYMDLETRSLRDEWLASQLLMMHVVMHELNQSFTLAVGLRDILKIRGIKIPASEAEPPIVSTLKKLETLCDFWKKLNYENIPETEVSLLKRKMIMSSIRLISIALRRMAQDFQKSSYYSSLKETDRKLFDVLIPEMEDVQMCLRYYLRGELDLDDLRLDGNFATSMQDFLEGKFSNSVIMHHRDPWDNCMIRGNLSALRRVISNLVANAFKHGQSKRIFVIITLREREKEMTIQILNDISEGQNGFAPQWLEEVEVVVNEGQTKTAQRLFVESYTTTKDDGWKHGLGLKLCWGLVEAMGGTLQVRCQNGLTVFKITLPLKGATSPANGTGHFFLPQLKAYAGSRLPDKSL